MSNETQFQARRSTVANNTGVTVGSNMPIGRALAICAVSGFMMPQEFLVQRSVIAATTKAANRKATKEQLDASVKSAMLTFIESKASEAVSMMDQRINAIATWRLDHGLQEAEIPTVDWAIVDAIIPDTDVDGVPLTPGQLEGVAILNVFIKNILAVEEAITHMVSPAYYAVTK